MKFRGMVLIIALCVGSPCWASDAGLQQIAAGDESAAVRVLKSLPREWSRSSKRDCGTYEDKNIDRLSPAFAASAAALLKAFVETHGHVTITSAHRTAEEQTCVCDGERGLCAGRPRIIKGKKGRRYVKRSTSRHQEGIALDVRPGMGTDEEFACCMSSRSSIRSTACTFRWASAIDHIWSQARESQLRFGSLRSVTSNRRLRPAPRCGQC
jgi:hypothetical protein